MDLVPKPNATLTDDDVADALNRACAVIDPLLDLLSGADPIGLREHSREQPVSRGARRGFRRVRLWFRRLRRGSNLGDSAMDAGAWVLNAADLPGTASWERMDREARVKWWVHRVGALDNLVVAAPGLFGWLNRLLPIGTLAGFINQAVVLCAVAREYGVTDRETQVRLLAEVLCQRQLPAKIDLNAEPELEPAPETAPVGFISTSAITNSVPVQITKKVWQLAGILRALSDEAGKRPHSRRIYRWLSALPGIGFVANYLGERGALVRAAKAGQAWLTAYIQSTRGVGG